MSKMSRSSSKNNEIRNTSRRKLIWFSIFAGFLLLITNSAYWFNNQIFNKDNFTSTVTTSLTSESSRFAIAENVTNRIFTDRPIAKRVAGDFTTKIISGLLDTEQFKSILAMTVERTQAYATSSNQEDVVIELGTVKDILTQITAISESLGREATIDPENIPESIVLINEENVPDLYSYGVVLLWVAPITLTSALLLLAYPYIKKRGDSKRILFTQGIIIMLTSFIGFLVGPLFRPPVLAQISVENRTVVGDLFDAFIATYNSQTALLALVGLSAVVISSAWIGYPHIKKAVGNKTASTI
jgi:energy-converting hydrogenase Eha subunit E